MSKLIKQNKTITNVIQRNKLGILQVPVPSELIGTIIGKGGQIINQIRGESLANIKIDTSKSKSAYGFDEQIITITGTAQQIQVAQDLIEDRLTLTNQLSSLMLQVTTINRIYKYK